MWPAGWHCTAHSPLRPSQRVSHQALVLLPQLAHLDNLASQNLGLLQPRPPAHHQAHSLPSPMPKIRDALSAPPSWAALILSPCNVLE